MSAPLIVAVVPTTGPRARLLEARLNEIPARLMWVEHILTGGRAGTCSRVNPHWSLDYTCPECNSALRSASPDSPSGWREALILAGPQDPQLGKLRAMELTFGEAPARLRPCGDRRYEALQADRTWAWDVDLGGPRTWLSRSQRDAIALGYLMQERGDVEEIVEYLYQPPTAKPASQPRRRK